MKGGITYGQCPVHRRAGTPIRIPGFDELDPRRVSAAGSPFRGGVPSAYGGVAPRWEPPDRPPVCRVPKLSLAHPRGSALVYSCLCEDVLPASGPRTPVRHGAEQSQSVDPRLVARPAGGPAHPRRCPDPLPGGPGPATRRLGGGRGDRGHAPRGQAGPPRPRTSVPPFAHDGTERRIVRPQDAVEQTGCYSGKKKDHTVKNVLLSMRRSRSSSSVRPTAAVSMTSALRRPPHISCLQGASCYRIWASWPLPSPGWRSACRSRNPGARN